MALTASMMLDLGTKASEFSVPDTDGNTVSLSDFADRRALVVMFICNHCPFVKHVAVALREFGAQYQNRGVGVVAINANDAVNFPDDNPERMKEEKALRGYTFPYLIDQTQEVAKSYHAACTPDFFVFDGRRELVYRGQMDDSRPENDIPVTGKDLRAAVDAVLEGRAVTGPQTPSVGCNIKWKSGNEPDP